MRSGSTDDRCDSGRRRLVLGAAATLAGGGLLCAPPSLADDPLEPADEAALFANLFTRMSVRTRLNGQGPFNFVIDTGASRTAIAEETAALLQLPLAEDVLVHGVTSAEMARSVHLARMEAAGRRFNNLQPCLFPRALLAADGLLGLDVLSRYRLEIDLGRRTVELTPSGPDRVTFGDAFAMPSRLRRNDPSRSRTGRFGQLILLNARVEGVLADCFVDSGAQFSIGNLALQRAVGERQGRSPYLNPIRVFGVTGQEIIAYPGAVSQLEVARQRMGQTRLLFADLHAFGALQLEDRPALLLGADIISRFDRVSLDFGMSRMTFSGLRRQLPPVATA